MRKSPLTLLAVFLSLVLPALAAAKQQKLDSAVLKMPLAQGISVGDAVQSMKLRANALNFKLVADLPLYKELEAMGVPTKRVEIFQFCDARIAHQMLMYDIDFAAYLPCRIALIQDKNGKAWLVTLDLDKVIRGANLPPDLKKLAVKVRDTINSIMKAGANGDL
ncbi:MAG: DUF302 domain-containing protein [Chromatiaceae bacterium]|jgi:uncharacterized protein (DUF302 family)